MDKSERIAIGRIRHIKRLLKDLAFQISVNPSLKAQMNALQMKKGLAEFMGVLIQLVEQSDMKWDEVVQQIEERMNKKKQVERFNEYSKELVKFISSGFRVVNGTPEEMMQQLSIIIEHADGLWNDSVVLFRRKRFANACFLSLVCIEECAKVSFGEFQFYSKVINPASSTCKDYRGKNPLNAHSKKHFLAACGGALVNSRMDRILGMDKVDSFIKDCETGRLEKLRQSCLYADVNQRGSLLVPSSQITNEQAFFYMCLAGELLAEVVGENPIRWRILRKLEKFENENGMSALK